MAMGEAMKALVNQLRQSAAVGGPDFTEMVEGMSALADEFKPKQSGTRVTVTFDAKAVGGFLRSFFFERPMAGPNRPGSKGGL